MSKEKAPAATAVVEAAAPEAEELPKTIVRRVVKEKLSEISTDGGDVTLHKEALIAFSESARIFIHYLSATAHDICSDSNRQIINADDVLNALEEVEFSEFIEPLRASLNEFRKKTAVKRAGSAKAKEENKKRKADEETATENGKAGETVVENGDDEETAVENGEDEEAVVENGKDEDNEDEDEDEEEASENKDDSYDS
ncbi:DNA polymerase epsilon subunit 3-like [Chenopodium quinoa]|uniref:DNA polymerase epsilon subunit 3-like n=1 Tax=Chenopodium quinoa TaxID=63459 RepID=UPI000B796301|nr:DNA polymerase epsilon subunit 3-like [Chenopodium quinoa]